MVAVQVLGKKMIAAALASSLHMHYACIYECNALKGIVATRHKHMFGPQIKLRTSGSSQKLASSCDNLQLRYFHHGNFSMRRQQHLASAGTT